MRRRWRTRASCSTRSCTEITAERWPAGRPGGSRAPRGAGCPPSRSAGPARADQTTSPSSIRSVGCNPARDATTCDGTLPGWIEASISADAVVAQPRDERSRGLRGESLALEGRPDDPRNGGRVSRHGRLQVSDRSTVFSPPHRPVEPSFGAALQGPASTPRTGGGSLDIGGWGLAGPSTQRWIVEHGKEVLRVGRRERRQAEPGRGQLLGRHRSTARAARSGARDGRQPAGRAPSGT